MNRQPRASAVPRFPSADVTWLAKEWEGQLAAQDYPTRKFAVLTLVTLCAAYLRGRGTRMGNYPSFSRHLPVQAKLLTEVAMRVFRDPAKDIWFPTVVRLGFSSVETAVSIFRELES